MTAISRPHRTSGALLWFAFFAISAARNWRWRVAEVSGLDVVVAQGLRSRVRDYGRVWDFDGKSARICAIGWRGP